MLFPVQHRSFLPIALITIAALAGIAPAAAEDFDLRPPHILIVHSYSTDFQWTRDLDQAIRRSFRDATDDTAVVRSEFLGTKHHNSEDYFFALAQFLATKYAGREFDLIIVTDNLGFDFLKRYRDAVFGAVPTVFAGINDYRPAMIEGFFRVTGVAESLDIEETIAFALRVMGGDTIHVIDDGTVTSERNVRTVSRAVAHLGSDLTLHTHGPLGLDRLPDVADTVNRDDIVLLVGSILGEDGGVMDFDRAGRLVAEAMPVPVFSFWDFFMGTGIAGGKLVSGHAQGEAAVEIGLKILNGTEPRDIPVVTASPNGWFFDWQALTSGGIDPARVPDGTEFINRPRTMWTEFRSQIVVAIIIIAILLTLVSLLFINIRYRAMTSQRLRTSLNEKEVLLKEIHHRVKNNLQVVSSILNMQGAMISDPTAHSYFKDCETRVHSMALVHEQLYQSSSLTLISLPNYVEELVATLMSAVGGGPSRVTVKLDIEDIEMDLDRSIPIGLMINELVSNALKYAYPDSDGTVTVSMHRTDDGLELSVRDAGIGIADDQTATASLGIQLVEALSAQLDGGLELRDAHPGVDARVTIRSAPIAEGRRSSVDAKEG